MRILYTIIFIFLLGVFSKPGLKIGELTTDDCKDCHTTLFEKDHLHPVMEDACENCHEAKEETHPQTGVKGFNLTGTLPELCFMCHEEYNTKEYLHYPASEGECLACHSPHSSDYNGLLLTSPVSKTCYMCHDEDAFKHEFTHQPVFEGSCQGCHDAHHSDNSGLLREEMPGLCFICHGDFEAKLEMKKIHPPFADDCSNCHHNHSSENMALLNEALPDLCYICHDDINQSLKEDTIQHTPMLDSKTCANCHSPHASDIEGYLLSDKTDLCIRCHNKTLDTKQGSISNIAGLLEKKKFVHGAIYDNGCVTCHKPHSSMYNSLLNDNYPPLKYVAGTVENYGLCFNCHDSELLTAEKTKYGTNFRNGETNLHYLHLKGEQGRSCSLCHNMHASDNPFLILNELSYGDWTMKMNFETSDNGGTCFPGCHGASPYNRNGIP